MGKLWVSSTFGCILESQHWSWNDPTKVGKFTRIVISNLGLVWVSLGWLPTFDQVEPLQVIVIVNWVWDLIAEIWKDVREQVIRNLLSWYKFSVIGKVIAAYFKSGRVEVVLVPVQNHMWADHLRILRLPQVLNITKVWVQIHQFWAGGSTDLGQSAPPHVCLVL